MLQVQLPKPQTPMSQNDNPYYAEQSSALSGGVAGAAPSNRYGTSDLPEDSPLFAPPADMSSPDQVSRPLPLSCIWPPTQVNSSVELPIVLISICSEECLQLHPIQSTSVRHQLLVLIGLCAYSGVYGTVYILPPAPLQPP